MEDMRRALKSDSERLCGRNMKDRSFEVHDREDADYGANNDLENKN